MENLKTAKFVKFLKFIRPDEKYKWWNRDEYCTLYVNPDSISFIDIENVSYYESSRETSNKPVVRLHFKGIKDGILVKGTEEEVLQKLDTI